MCYQQGTQNQPWQRTLIISGGHEPTEQDLSRGIATNDLIFFTWQYSWLCVTIP